MSSRSTNLDTNYQLSISDSLLNNLEKQILLRELSLRGHFSSFLDNNSIKDSGFWYLSIVTSIFRNLTMMNQVLNIWQSAFQGSRFTSVKWFCFNTVSGLPWDQIDNKHTNFNWTLAKQKLFSLQAYKHPVEIKDK